MTSGEHGMNAIEAKRIVEQAPVIADCDTCGSFALLPRPNGDCFWCSGWDDREDIWQKNIDIICDRLLGEPKGRWN